MTEQSGPWSTGGGLSVDQWAEMMATFFGAPSAEIFGVNGDPFTSDLQVFGDSSGRQVKLPVGMAIVDGAWYYNDAQQILTIGANGSGNPRIDTVCLRRATGSSTVSAIVVPGTPAGSPVAPTLTNQDLRLADVTVANGAVTIASGNVADKRTYVPRGFIVCTHATRPSTARAGQAIFETDTLLGYVWTGSVWAKLAVGDSDWQDLTGGLTSGWQDYAGHNVDSGSYHTVGYRKVGQQVFLRGLVQRATSGTGGSTITTLPTGYRPDSTHVYFIRSLVKNTGVQVTVHVDGTVTVVVDAAFLAADQDYFPLTSSFLAA